MNNIRIGHGFDVHQYGDDQNKKIVLGGVSFVDSPGLIGHSDGDVIIHALVDSMVSPILSTDIGSMFPNTDDSNENLDSKVFLRAAVSEIGEAGWRVSNSDITVVADYPKIAPMRKSIESCLVEIVGGHISVKGKTSESIPSLAMGITCYVNTILERNDE